MIPINLGQSAARIGLAQALAQPQQQRRVVGDVDKSPQYGASARNYGLAEALQPISVDGGGWGEALAEALAGGLRGRAAQSERQGEVDREQWDTNREQKIEGARTGAISEALAGFDPNNPQGMVQSLRTGAPEEALSLAAALAGREQPETFTDPYELNGAQVQRSNRSNRVQPVVPAAPSFNVMTPQQVEQMGLEPGSYQQNAQTGQVAPINTQRGSPLERAQATADVERVTSFRQAADTDAATVMELNRFAGLNDQETGTGPNNPQNFAIGGWRPLANENTQQMVQIISRLTPQQRVPGSGATSDFDTRMFQEALPGINRAPAANDAIIAAYQARAQLSNERVALAEAWLESGSLSGMDTVWRQYVSVNPIFDPQSTPDEPRINPNRQNFMDWAAQNGIEIGGGAQQSVQQPRRRRWVNGRLE